MPLGTKVDLTPGDIVLDVNPARPKGERKERKSIYIAPFHTQVHTKRSGMDHTVLPANNTMHSTPNFGPRVVAKGLHGSRYHLVLG